MKYILAFSICLGSALSAAPATTPQTQPPAAGMQDPCSQLSVEERNFAGQLTQMEAKKNFCQNLTASQRAQVMAMTKPKTDSSTPMMTPDQAMSSFQTQQMPKSAPGAPASKTPGGGCPIQ